jgi:hypothetical protein
MSHQQYAPVRFPSSSSNGCSRSSGGEDRWPIGTNHFGYEGKTRVYWYNVASERCFRIWRANPVQYGDGTWDSYEGGADVVFSIKHDLKPKFLLLVAQDMQAPSLPDVLVVK